MDSMQEKKVATKQGRGGGVPWTRRSIILPSKSMLRDHGQRGHISTQMVADLSDDIPSKEVPGAPGAQAPAVDVCIAMRPQFQEVM